MTIDERLSRLEQRRVALDALATNGVACDTGPYELEGMLAGWHAEGIFESDNDRYEGLDEIGEFFGPLAAEFTLHIFSNPEVIAVEPGSVTLGCYGLEAPVLGGVAHFGAFSHQATFDTSGATALTRRWRQTIHLITPATLGWVNGPQIAEQTKETPEQSNDSTEQTF